MQLVKRCVEAGSKENPGLRGKPSKVSARDEREFVSIVRNDRRQRLCDIVGMFNQGKDQPKGSSKGKTRLFGIVIVFLKGASAIAVWLLILF